MEERPSVIMIVEMIQSAEELVMDLRSGSSPWSEIGTRLDQVRADIVGLAGSLMLLHHVSVPIPRVDGRHPAARDADRLKAGLLHAWGFASFLQHQVDTGTTNRTWLAEYAEGLLDEFIAVREELVRDPQA